MPYRDIYSDSSYRHINDYVLQPGFSDKGIKEALGDLKDVDEKIKVVMLQNGLVNIDKCRGGPTQEDLIPWDLRDTFRGRLVCVLCDGLDKIDVSEHLNPRDLLYAMKLLLQETNKNAEWKARGRALYHSMRRMKIDAQTLRELGYDSPQKLEDIFSDSEDEGFASQPNTPPGASAKQKRVSFAEDELGPFDPANASPTKKILKKKSDAAPQSVDEVIFDVIQHFKKVGKGRVDRTWREGLRDILRPHWSNQEIMMLSLSEIGLGKYVNEADRDMRLKYLYMFEGVKNLRFVGDPISTFERRFKQIEKADLPALEIALSKDNYHLMHEHFDQHLAEVERINARGLLKGIEPSRVSNYIDSAKTALFLHLTRRLLDIEEYIVLNVKREVNSRKSRERQRLLESILLFLDSFRISTKDSTLGDLMNMYEKMVQESGQVRPKFVPKPDYAKKPHKGSYAPVEAVDIPRLRIVLGNYLDHNWDHIL